MTWWLRWLGVLVLLLPGIVAAGEISLRDAETGLGLTGTVSYRLLDGPLAPDSTHIEALLADSAKRREITVHRRADFAIDQPVALRAEAPGFQPLHAVLRPSVDNQGWSLMLDPIDSPPVHEPSRADAILVQGWAVDADSLEAVEGARIGLEDHGVLAHSDAAGFFAFEVPAPPAIDDGPEPLRLLATSDGFQETYRAELLAGPGTVRTTVVLGTPGPGSAMHRQRQTDQPGPGIEEGERLALSMDRSGGDAPPASITVGFANEACTAICGRPGCLNACSHSCVFSLETYVRRGLPDEWFASWNFHALAAGAVAYRSYGAWHVLNPLPEGSWDVCSNACCQVNPPGFQASTDAAAAATSGLMLVRNGAIFRSEYSSQNNCLLGSLSCTNVDLSCGDGFAGSPAANWPCLEDPVGEGRDCFGHGRGMSQWGNQLWTQTTPIRRWAWQLNHYYNALGDGTGLRTATVSQALVIEAVRLPPVSAPGQQVVFELDVRNLAPDTHEQVMVGGSLQLGSGPFIDDPNNDQPVVLAPGQSTITRAFDLPADLAPGDYSVYLSLFIDVDGDQAISSEDLRQDLVILPAALPVVDGLFFDRFEG